MIGESAPSRLWTIVARREIAVKVRDRNFLLSTLFTVVAIAISLAISAFVNSRVETINIAVTGPGVDQVVQTAGRLADNAHAKIRLVTHTEPDTAAVEDSVRSGTVAAGLAYRSDGWRLVGKGSRDDKLSTYIGAAAELIAVRRNAIAAGTSLAQLQRGGAVAYDLLAPGAVDSGLAKVVGGVFGFLFYLASILFGLAIAQSVVAEKQNRIVEILVSAIPVRQLLIGKVIGNAAMALGQLTVFVGAGLVGLTVAGNGTQITRIAGAAVWFVAFFVVGFLALASLWAVVGALATRTEDLQSTSTPLTMLIMIVLLAGIFLSGTARTVASYIPLASVVAMPARLAAGTAVWWEPVIALALMTAAAYGTVMIAEKIYRRSLMQTQGRITIRQALTAED
jgi:ABC-2 type transport system permease protein